MIGPRVKCTQSFKSRRKLQLLLKLEDIKMDKPMDKETVTKVFQELEAQFLSLDSLILR